MSRKIKIGPGSVENSDNPTKRLNEQVTRNIKRFPEDFMFSLSYAEKHELVANCDHLDEQTIGTRTQDKPA